MNMVKRLNNPPSMLAKLLWPLQVTSVALPLSTPINLSSHSLNLPSPPPSHPTDEVSNQFRHLASVLGCSHDDFIRTTENRHKEAVATLWAKLEANGQIYLGAYEGWYSIRDEAFYQENELVDGKAPTGILFNHPLCISTIISMHSHTHTHTHTHTLLHSRRSGSGVGEGGIVFLSPV